MKNTLTKIMLAYKDKPDDPIELDCVEDNIAYDRMIEIATTDLLEALKKDLQPRLSVDTDGHSAELEFQKGEHIISTYFLQKGI